jgi:hypothetical protein
MPALNDINITNFGPTDSRGGYSSIGGSTTKQMPDGTFVSVRIDTLTISTEKLVAASKKLLGPTLDEVKVQSAANLAKFLDRLAKARQEALDAHKDFEKEQNKLFRTVSQQAVNQTLDGSASASATVEATVSPQSVLEV